MNRTSPICLLALALFAGHSHSGDPAPKDNRPIPIAAADLTALRARAAKERPVIEAFGWAVYRLDAQFYGVFQAKGSPEFIAGAMKKTESEIQITGPGEIIIDSQKRIAVPVNATAKLRGEEYEISGARSRVTVELP
jgi:hypothetical protein